MTEGRVVVDLAERACMDVTQEIAIGLHEIAATQGGEGCDDRSGMHQAHRREAEVLELHGQRSPGVGFGDGDGEMCASWRIGGRENWSLADRHASQPLVEDRGHDDPGGKSRVERFSPTPLAPAKNSDMGARSPVVRPRPVLPSRGSSEHRIFTPARALARTRRSDALLAAVVLGGGIAAGVGAGSPTAVAIVGIVAASATAPRAAVVAAVPTAVLASLVPAFEVAAMVAAAAIQIGVLVRCGRNLRLAPTLAVLAFMALLTISHLRGEGGHYVTVEVARNTLLSTFICLGLSLSAMAADVNRLALLRALAGTGAIGNIYLLNTGSFVGGRLSTEDFNPNATGHIAALALLAAWGTFLATRRWWWLACALPAALLLVLSQSRGALVIVSVGLGIPWIFLRLSFARVLLAGAITMVLYAAWPVISSGLALLLSSRVYEESETRVNVLQLALRAIGEHPLTGLGWRRFPDYSYSHLGVFLETHNEYARVAAESGLLALVALLTLAFMGLRRPMADRTDRGAKGVLLGGLTALAFADSLSVLAICAPLWLVLGITLSARRDRSRTDAVSPQRTPGRQS